MQDTKAITAYKQGLRLKILATVMNDFRQRGIRAVKMDDVATELGISKRTLYEIFDKKEDLLYETLKYYHVERRKMIQVKIQHCANVMEIILAVYRIKVEEFQKTNPNFYVDLVKYPQVLRFLNQEKLSNRAKFQQFIERGINEGFFRSDVNYELTTHLFDVLSNYVMQNQLYRQYTMEEIFKNLIFVTLRGMCTERGVHALDSQLG